MPYLSDFQGFMFQTVQLALPSTFPAKSPICKALAVMGFINLAITVTHESVYPWTLLCCLSFGWERGSIEVAMHRFFVVLKPSGFDIDIRFGNCVVPQG